MWFHSPAPWKTFTFPLLFGRSDWGRSYAMCRERQLPGHCLSRGYTCVLASHSWLWGFLKHFTVEQAPGRVAGVGCCRPTSTILYVDFCFVLLQASIWWKKQLNFWEEREGRHRGGTAQERHGQDVFLIIHRSPKHKQDEVLSHCSWVLFCFCFSLPPPIHFGTSHCVFQVTVQRALNDFQENTVKSE